MRSTLRTKVVALDRTGKTFTFRGTGYIYQLACFKNSNGYFVTNFQLGQFFFRQSKLMQTATCFNTRFRKMPSISLIDMACFFLTKGNLNGSIAVGIFGFHLSDAIRRHLQHSYRHRHALLGKYAGHPHFAPNQT